ncbi:hypothetical protein C0992_005874 [Termitomyces sp. T32_za158]|nr:hypothetical protein C0992_005874 [Termitomyces sp. T32_za158]
MNVSLLAAAHVEHPVGLRKAHDARQLSSVPSVAPSSPAAAGTPTPAGTSVVTPPISGVPTIPASGSVTGSISGVTSQVSTTPTTTFTFSLAATNPTAAPLSVIVSTATSSATIPLPTTFAPGATPTVVSGAPVLPNAALLSPANYPALDRVPPTDSDLVKHQTSPGGCPNNTAAAADGDRCWWTCGGCTRQTDITECPTAMTWGLTYDDGPAFYTPNLLTYLDQVNLKSTFFVVGSRVISFPTILQNEYMSGHQIAVHTWSHPPLTTLTNEQIIAELGWSKKVIKDVLGVTPNMMRPPYGDIDDRVRAISAAMGLTPVVWTRISPTATFDTDDFNIHGGLSTVQQVLQNWENIISNATTMHNGFIVLEHDLFQQSVEVATGYILPDAMAHQPPFTIQPVISCLKKPLSDAYIETNDNKTNPPPVSGIPVTATSSASAGNHDNSGSSFRFGSELLAGSLTAVTGLAAGLALLL